MKVSVIIPTMKGREKLLANLLKSIPMEYERIIVDDEDLLLAAKRNKGAKKANGEYLCFIDDDNVLEPGAIEEALEVCELAASGVVGFMACYSDKPDRISDGGSMRNILTGFTWGQNTNLPYGWTGMYPYMVDEVANAFMIHSELYYELNGFDERLFPIDLDEADLCKRIKNKGLKILICPKARSYHVSQTYSHIPDFRRPLNAFYMGRNRILYQRIYNSNLRYMLYLVFFMPVFISFYWVSLIYRRKPMMIHPFTKGVIHGLFCRTKNQHPKG